MGARLRIVFVVAGLTFMAVACARALDGAHELPSWGALAAAGALSAIGLAAAAGGWVALADRDAPPTSLLAGFFAGQVGKYIPGGVWVGAGQVGFGMGAGLSAGRATGALATYGVCLVAAAGVVVALGAVAGTAGPPTPWLSALGLALPLLLVRGRLAGLAAWLGKRLPARVGGIDVPPQRAILSCLAWLVPAIACSALAFALLLRAAGTGIPAATALWGFAVAWLAGFLALGLPSGVGAREAVLVLLLDTGIGPVVTASVAHRLVQALAEALLLASVHRHVPGAARSS